MYYLSSKYGILIKRTQTFPVLSCNEEDRKSRIRSNWDFFSLYPFMLHVLCKPVYKNIFSKLYHIFIFYNSNHILNLNNNYITCTIAALVNWPFLYYLNWWGEEEGLHALIDPKTTVYYYYVQTKMEYFRFFFQLELITRNLHFLFSCLQKKCQIDLIWLLKPSTYDI